MNGFYSDPIGHKARVGQAPPAGPPPAERRILPAFGAGGDPAKPGHAEAER